MKSNTEPLLMQVLTLWVAVVAQRQGFSRNAGLTFGKAIAGMLAQSKGKSIGVIQDSKKVRQLVLDCQRAEICYTKVLERIDGVMNVSCHDESIRS